MATEVATGVHLAVVAGIHAVGNCAAFRLGVESYAYYGVRDLRQMSRMLRLPLYVRSGRVIHEVSSGAQLWAAAREVASKSKGN